MALGLGPTPGASGDALCTSTVLPDPSACVVTNSAFGLVTAVVLSPSTSTNYWAGVTCDYATTRYQLYTFGDLLGSHVDPMYQDLVVPC
jgi:hypothetical protein